MDKDRLYSLEPYQAIRRQIDRENVDEEALLRGSIGLLQDDSREWRRRAARFLGRLRDRSAIVPLVEALGDRDATLQEDICYTLQWFGGRGEPAESALIKLRREDPSVEVGVAAAVALCCRRDKDALAAFELGLGSTKRRSVREICERGLEQLGRLKPALPENAYTQISEEEYERIKGRRSWRDTVRHEIRRGDTIYLEVDTQPAHRPPYRQWYRVVIDRSPAAQKRKRKIQEMRGTSLSPRGNAGQVRCIALSPDEKQLASGGEDATIRLWQLHTGKTVYILKGHTDAVLRVTFDHAGNHLSSTANDGTVRIWDVSTGQPLHVLKQQTNFAVDALTFSQDGKRVLATSDLGKKLRAWDTTTGKQICFLKLRESVRDPMPAVVLSPNGKRVALAGEDVAICDAETGKEIIKAKNPTGNAFSASPLAFSPDGSSLACGGNWTVLLDPNTGKEIPGRQGHPWALAREFSVPWTLAYSTDGKRIVSADGG
jgi:hypothetical protein